VLDEISFDDESLDVQVSTYRSFVNAHPGQTSYFQPILDRLEVVPSKFDMHEASVVLEGKSDYYVLRYGARMLGIADLPLLPGLGAGTFGALAALHAGWNLNFLFLLDGDRQGKIERDRYAEEFGIALGRLLTLDQLIPKTKVIEDLLDDEARQTVSDRLGLAALPDKGQIRRFFQERLASDNTEPLGAGFEAKVKAALEALRTRLEASA
jgi:hypothetical protein